MHLIDTESETTIDATLFDQSVTILSVLDPRLLLPEDQVGEGEEGEIAVYKGWYLEQKCNKIK